MHTCMLKAGYARARLNTTQLIELDRLPDAEARNQLLLRLIDEAGKDPGRFVFVDESTRPETPDTRR